MHTYTYIQIIQHIYAHIHIYVIANIFRKMLSLIKLKKESKVWDIFNFLKSEDKHFKMTPMAAKGMGERALSRTIDKIMKQ